MTHITCRLTAKNRDQLRNPTLDNRVYGLPLPFTCICRQRCILRKPTDGDRLNDVRLDYSCNTRTGRISKSNRPEKSETGNGNNNIVFSESIRGCRDSVQHRGVFAGHLRLHRSTTYSSLGVAQRSHLRHAAAAAAAEQTDPEQFLSGRQLAWDCCAQHLTIQLYTVVRYAANIYAHYYYSMVSGVAQW